MDNFCEQLVEKQSGSSAKTRRMILIFVGGALVLALLIITIMFMGNILSMFTLLMALGSAYMIYTGIQNMQIEYEYTFTNGELDIDKIIAKKKRKELISVDVKTFSSFGRYNENMPETEDMTVVLCSDNIASHEYYADLQHGEYGNTRIIFSPNDELLDSITVFLPVKLKKWREEETAGERI